MKFWKLVSVVALNLVTSANAALIDNGAYTTDDVTGLNWLDLSHTNNQYYYDAFLNNYNAGWRLATNTEVENLFTHAFSGFYETNTQGTSYETEGAYTGQSTDVAVFLDLFGCTRLDIYGCASYGFYRDEDNVSRIMGAWGGTNDDTLVLGLEHIHAYNEANTSTGVFMVNSSVVPVPAAVWLFGSGLIGLVGFAKRKKA